MLLILWAFIYSSVFETLTTGEMSRKVKMTGHYNVQFDISANALEIGVVQVQKCMYSVMCC
jgi:hypothetical protein